MNLKKILIHHIWQLIICIVLFIICVYSCKKTTCPSKSEQSINRQGNFKTIVQGVYSLGSSHAIPGPIATDSNWISIAFCPFYYDGGVKKKPGIFAAARLCGDGRIFAMGHEGFFGPDLDEENNRQFGKNVVEWLDITKKRRICVRQTQWSTGIEQGLIKELKTAEYTSSFVKREDELTENDLKNCDVLVYSTRWDPVTDKEIDTVISFINNGGGVLLTGLGWSYASYINQDLREFPMNKIGLRIGLMFLTGFLYDSEQNYGNKPEYPVIHHLYPEIPDD